MISIIVALESEATPVVNIIEDRKDFIISGKKVYLGKISGKEISLIISGIGKVNASISTQIMIDKYNPDYVINFGSAGGVINNVKVGQYYLIEKSVQYDFDVSELDNVPVGYIQDYDRVFFDSYSDTTLFPTATLATGDRFSENIRDQQMIVDMGCSVKDMEGAAIAQTCLANNVKLVMLKGITDVFGSETTFEQFRKNLTKVCQGFSEVVTKLLNKI